MWWAVGTRLSLSCPFAIFVGFSFGTSAVRETTVSVFGGRIWVDEQSNVSHQLLAFNTTPLLPCSMNWLSLTGFYNRFISRCRESNEKRSDWKVTSPGVMRRDDVYCRRMWKIESTATSHTLTPPRDSTAILRCWNNTVCVDWIVVDSLDSIIESWFWCDW